jgi:hypothetical protein
MRAHTSAKIRFYKNPEINFSRGKNSWEVRKNLENFVEVGNPI